MDKRRHERHRLRKAMTISWMSDAGPVSCIGTSINASAYGVLVEVLQPTPVGTQITIQIDGSDERVEGTVRHCRKYGTWYRMGLQVTTPLTATEQKCQKWTVNGS